MVAVIVGMLVCLGAALGVLAMVAVPARRAGEELFTEQGEQVIDALKVRARLPRRGGAAVAQEEPSREPADLLS